VLWREDREASAAAAREASAQSTGDELRSSSELG